jgi:hypothetical protein
MLHSVGIFICLTDYKHELWKEEGPRFLQSLEMARDIQRLPTIHFSLVLRKEYFDCPQRDSHAVHYIEKMVESRQSVILLCSVVLQCNRNVLHRPLCADSDKISEGRSSTYILQLSGNGSILYYILYCKEKNL